MATAIQATIRSLPDTEYHSLKSLSRSQFKDFVTDPALYHGRYVTGIFPPVAKDCFALGHAFEQVALHSIAGHSDAANHREIIAIPDDALTSNGHRRGKAWEAFKAEHEAAGSILLLPKIIGDISRMTAGAEDNKQVVALFWAAEYIKPTIEWIEDEHGLALRSQPDLFSEAWAADIKSTVAATPEGFAKQVFSCGYHIQEAWIRRAAAALGQPLQSFAFIASLKVPPFTTEVYQLAPEWLEIADATIDRHLAYFAERKRTDRWHRKGHGSVQVIAPPQYARYAADWEFDDGE